MVLAVNNKVLKRLRGIPDLAKKSIVLRVQWIWRMCTNPLRPCIGFDMQFLRNKHNVFASSARIMEFSHPFGKTIGSMVER